MQLKAQNLSFRYNDKSPWILKDLSLEVKSGERVGIIAPSGYGKSTLAKLLSGYLEPREGKILLDDKPLPSRGFCPVQLISQHPELAVNPRWRMGKILNEARQVPKELMDRMGIEEAWLSRWSAELSGGELQRFCIARVLVPETKFLICDEITTMLDVITQAQIWQVLLERAEKNNLGLIVISHNPALAQKVCTRIIRLDEI